MNIHKIIRARLKVPVGDEQPRTLDDLKSNWSSEFVRLMQNRMMMGGLRYGLLREQKAGGSYDNITSALTRIRNYQKTGNTEHLVDAANLMLVEYVTGTHPRKHFAATDDGQHTGAK